MTRGDKIEMAMTGARLLIANATLGDARAPLIDDEGILSRKEYHDVFVVIMNEPRNLVFRVTDSTTHRASRSARLAFGVGDEDQTFGFWNED